MYGDGSATCIWSTTGPIFSVLLNYYELVNFFPIGYDHSGAAWNPNGPVYFYNKHEPYYEFTNFYRGGTIFLDSCQWPTSEHYFQAQKFVGTPYVELIRDTSWPREAFNLSRDPKVSKWIRSDWEEVKVDIMRKVLFAKFTQSKHLKSRLLGTGDRELVERSPYDGFWGDGGDGTGQNRLGKLLMELRMKLQGKQTEDDVYHDGFSWNPESIPLLRKLVDAGDDSSKELEDIQTGTW